MVLTFLLTSILGICISLLIALGLWKANSKSDKVNLEHEQQYVVSRPVHAEPAKELANIEASTYEEVFSSHDVPQTQENVAYEGVRHSHPQTQENIAYGHRSQYIRGK